MDTFTSISSTQTLEQAPAPTRSPSFRADRRWFLSLPFSVMVALTFANQEDDPFITLRYAANVLHGRGLVFNPGQHVEGFTSPLHLVVAMFAVLAPGSHALLVLKLA
jgi:hypothetical protein